MIIFQNKISKVIFTVLLPILVVRYAFHILFFVKSPQKNVIESEVGFVLEEYKVKKSKLIGFIWAIHNNPYFLSLFYYRIGQSRAYICSLFKKDRSEFNICCDKLGTVKFYHPFATILNAKSIGDNFVCRNNTTIGNVHNDYSMRPTIGNNVELGANVVIFGNITIGDNVTIGAGTVVNKDIPSNCVAVGNPFRIIKRLD